MSNDTETWTIFGRSAALFMAIVGAISLLAITGWVFDLPILASVRPEFIPMAPSTALIFLGLCGVWLIYRVFSARGWMRILVQVSLVGLLLIVLILAIRYFTGFGPDFEQILIPNPRLFGQVETGRISPLTALRFFLAISAFLLITGDMQGERLKNAAGGLSLVVLILSSLNILGYVYGAPPFYGSTLIPVALTTAISFLFLSLGLLMTAGPTCWPVSVYVGSSLKARLIRTFLPASIVIVLLQGFLSNVSTPWIINPAIRVAVAAFAAVVIVFLIISFIANNLSQEIERSDQARVKAESDLNQSEARFRSLVESAKDAIINVDRDGHIVFWNPAAEMIFGYSAKEMIGKSLGMIMPKEFRAAHEQGLQRVALTGESYIIGKTVEMMGLRKDGNVFPLEVSLATWQVGEAVFFTGITRDISKRKHIELVQNAIYRITQAAITSNGTDALYQSIHSILGELVSAENFFIALYDPATGLISFPYFVDHFDKPPSEPTQMRGLTGYVIRSGRSLLATREMYDILVQHGDVEAVGRAAEAYLRVPLKLEGHIIGVIGVQSYTKGIHFHQEDVDLLEFVSTQVAQAIGRKRLEEEILSLSLTDELTGLHNRRGFTLLAERELKIAHRMKRAMLLYFCDVDNLKTINDTWGHAQGDQALIEISAILKQNFRESDILARIGGDEFVVLAVDASKESADFITNRIQAALDALKLPGNESHHLALSLGISFFDPKVPCTLNELLIQADHMMYEQKQGRKGK